MHEPQPNLRLAAETAFFESLDQLQNILAEESQTGESESLDSGDSLSQSFADSQVMEDAADDLEAFFGDEKLPEDGVFG